MSAASFNFFIALILVAVTVPAQADIALYNHSNFHGRSLKVKEVVANLTCSGFDNTVTSFKIPEGERWLLYEGPDFSGQMTIRRSGNYPHAGDTGLPNDSLSSLRKIPNYGGPLILLFSKTIFHGKMVVLKGDIVDMDHIVFDNEVSSIIVLRGNWTAFSGPNFTGKMYHLAPGRYASPNIHSFDNDVISSVRVS